MREQYEVVISGISGSFPKCLDPQKLEDSIYNHENLVDDQSARWNSTDVSRKIGAISNYVKFDDTFFGIHRKLTIILDPHAKHTFEKTFEAICDAGRNPIDFYNTNTGLFASSGINETEGENMMDWKHIGHLIIGYSRCMQSNRVCYAFNFNGPSVTFVSSWEGGLTALELARSLIAKGHIRQAVVAGTNIVHYPQIARQFQALGKLNEDGMTKSFSADADGYSRSDSVVALFLQRSEDAIRSYGTLVKSMTRSEMRSSHGITDPCGFKDFLGDFYADTPVKPEEVAFVQADGCASLRIDAMELDGLSEVMCGGRSKPLPVTSIKSKLGHTEGASSLVSVVAALIAMKTGYIPPVLHYNKPNPLASSLTSGKIKIVTEKTPVQGDYVGVTAIGLTSTFGHALLKRNPKSKTNVNPDYFPEDGIPRLFLLSGRDEDVMKSLLKEIEVGPIDDNLYMMNHTLFKKGFPKHLYKGYSLKSPKKQQSQVTPYSGEKRPVWFIFSGMGSQWPEMGRGVMMVPIMRKSIERSHKVLEPRGLDLINIITSNDPTIFDNILHCFVGIAAIQIALVDLLEEVGIKADGYVGHSVGELGCGYADKCFTAEQMILAAYARGTASNEANLIKGMMAAVGKGYNALKNDLPDGVEIACHNSSTSCTLSGPAELVKDYVQKLKDRGIFAKLVNVANMPYHSKNIAPAAPLLLKYLKEIVPEPKKRSKKWISSSVPESGWDREAAKFCSAEYHTNNLLSYVLFEEAAAHVPKNAICIEIAPHGLLQAIIKKSLSTCTHIPLTNRAKEGVMFTIEALALAFCNGIDVDLTKLYPPVELPLPRETPNLQRFITWNHSEDWVPISLERNLENIKKNRSNKDVYLFSQPEEIYQLSMNHRISGSTVYPLVNLLRYMMDYMSEKLVDSLNFKTYEIRDLKIYNPLILDRTDADKLRLLYQSGSGHFEMVFDDVPLVGGLINPLMGSPHLHAVDSSPTANSKQLLHLKQEEIYQFFEEKECFFNSEYRNISEIKVFQNGFIGKVKWAGNSEVYLDAITKLMMLYYSTECDVLMQIESIGELLFTPSQLPNNNNADVYVYFERNTDELVADGIRIHRVRTRPAPFRPFTSEIEKPVFLPYSEIQSQGEFFKVCLDTIIDLSGDEEIKVVGNKSSGILHQMIQHKHVASLLQAQSKLKVLECSNEVKLERDLKGSHIYLFVSDDKLPDALVSQINGSAHTCYLIQAPDKSDINSMTKFKFLTPILERNINGKKLLFYKKTINLMVEADFVQVPIGFILDKPSPEDIEFQRGKLNFLLYKYNKLSDILIVLKNSKEYMHSPHYRFVFLDDDASFFNPVDHFYHLQLKKSFKINVCHKGSWGTLNEAFTEVPILTENVFQEQQTPLNKIRCEDVDLKVIGLNMQYLLNPSIHDKLGAIDYCGVTKGRSPVLGLAQLTSDNNIKVDPILMWKRPSHWTEPQAATVPFSYSLAYYLLEIRLHPNAYPAQSVFIHGGHCCFSQAVINVILGRNKHFTIYTTCFTLLQKQFILKRFPEIKASNIYVLDNSCKFEFDDIYESSGGKGVDLVIDSLNDDNFRECMWQSLGKNARYVYLCNNHTKTDCSFGMMIFMRELAIFGLNPDMLLDMSEEKKYLLAEMVEKGIMSGHVQPLDSTLLEGDCSRKRAAEEIISWSTKQEKAKKVLLSMEKTLEAKVAPPSSQSNGNHITSNNYIIIGSHRNLWYDVLKWLASKGAQRVFIIIDVDTLPSYQQFRLKRLLDHFNNLKITFLDMDHLNSEKKMEESLTQLGETLQHVFYIMPGMDKELKIVDEALRKHCKKASLVCIGNLASSSSANNSSITDQRLKQGFKGVSLVLKKDLVKNRTVINVLDYWMTCSDQREPVILLDEHEQNEVDTAITDPDILPRTADDLTEMLHESSPVPCFKEMQSASPPREFAKELDPVFFFPGFRISKMRNFISKFPYPSFMAKYPPSVKSYDQIASHLAKELLKYKKGMFSLVAEGWAGPLVLKIASLLEKDDRVSQLILIDATPSTIRKWSKALSHSQGILSRSIPSPPQGQEISVEELKRSKEGIVERMGVREDSELGEELSTSMDILIERLELLQSIQQPHTKIRSKVHIFTARQNPMINQKEASLILEMCRLQCNHHVVYDTNIDDLLDSKNLQSDVRNLVMTEYQSAARKQNISHVSTLKTIDLK